MGMMSGIFSRIGRRGVLVEPKISLKEQIKVAEQQLAAANLARDDIHRKVAEALVALFRLKLKLKANIAKNDK